MLGVLRIAFDVAVFCKLCSGAALHHEIREKKKDAASPMGRYPLSWWPVAFDL